jgi:hypothetical protein
MKIERLETGSVKFGEDWTGVFIRGDNAIFYLQNLAHLAELEEVKKNPFLSSAVKDLMELMTSSFEHIDDPHRTYLKGIQDCLHVNYEPSRDKNVQS